MKNISDCLNFEMGDIVEFIKDIKLDEFNVSEADPNIFDISEDKRAVIKAVTDCFILMLLLIDNDNGKVDNNFPLLIMHEKQTSVIRLAKRAHAPIAKLERDEMVHAESVCVGFEWRGLHLPHVDMEKLLEYSR